MTVPAGNSAQARAHGGADAIIFDCDNTLGLPLKDVDDGLALALLLGQPTVNVVAVTTTFGNGTIEQVCTQTRRLLNRLGRADLPIYRGAAQPTNDKTAAAEFLANAVAQRPGQITIVATGPLTTPAGCRDARSTVLQQCEADCLHGRIPPQPYGRATTIA